MENVDYEKHMDFKIFLHHKIHELFFFLLFKEVELATEKIFSLLAHQNGCNGWSLTGVKPGTRSQEKRHKR